MDTTTLYDLAIVGAGLSTMSALRENAFAGRTIVLEYSPGPGGFLRPALPAQGFAEAWQLVEAFSVPESVTAWYNAAVIGLIPALTAEEPHTLVVRLRQGTVHVQARKIVIATGGLEQTRERDYIPGSRPAGVMTPLLAHQFLSRDYMPGNRALVYGDSRYAAATAQRLVGAGLQVTTIAPLASTDTFSGERAELIEVFGFPRLEGVRLRNEQQTFELPVDTLVYAAAMMPNTHWLKGSGVNLRANGAVEVDAHYCTNIAGVYATGTVVAPSLDHLSSISMGKEVGSLLTGGLV